MKGTVLLCFVTCMFATSALAAGSGIGAFPVAPPSPAAPQRSGAQAGQANTLNSSDRAKVAKFVNSNLPPHWMPVPIYSPVESYRATVSAGRSDIFVLLDISGRGYSNILLIYSKDSTGNLQSQVLDGWKMNNLEQMVRDLNGDGSDELIITTSLDGGSWTPTPATPAWPAIYRLVNGKYVEDSRDFPNYYDTEILRQLDKAIAAAKNHGYSDVLAMDLLEKNKILRVLGRNPVAGLNHAYQWMNSDDPILMQCAIATFADVGGHDKEVRTLQKALPGAIAHDIEARKGG